MDQNATAALITSVIAVVLGGLGLIGGVAGYVQGAAALRRATAARQRAATAEEAALQARAAAEAVLRTAEEERAERRRPRRPEEIQTGPITLPDLEPRPRARNRPRAGDPAPELAFADGTGPTATGPTPVAERASEPDVAPDLPAPPPAAVPDQLTATEALGPDDVPALAESDGPDPAEAAIDEPTEDAGEEPAGATGDPDDAVGERPAESSAAAEPASPPEAASEAPAPEDGSVGASPEEGPATGDADDAPAEPARPGRGQVSAANADAPTMDWAEALRTGAIPLPTKSRGTYSAPRRRPKPTGKGPARFELKMIGRQRFEAINVGGEAAAEAVVEGAGDDPHLIRPLSTRPITVQPGGTLAFSVLKVEGRDPSVQVHWTLQGEKVEQELPLT